MSASQVLPKINATSRTSVLPNAAPNKKTYACPDLDNSTQPKTTPVSLLLSARIWKSTRVTFWILPGTSFCKCGPTSCSYYFAARFVSVDVAAAAVLGATKLTSRSWSVILNKNSELGKKSATTSKALFKRAWEPLTGVRDKLKGKIPVLFNQMCRLMNMSWPSLQSAMTTVVPTISNMGTQRCLKRARLPQGCSLTLKRRWPPNCEVY